MFRIIDLGLIEQSFASSSKKNIKFLENGQISVNNLILKISEMPKNLKLDLNKGIVLKNNSPEINNLSM